MSMVSETALAISFIPFLVYFMLSWRDHINRSFLQFFHVEDRLVAARSLEGIEDMVRAFVVGNRVVAAMRRIAVDGEFRSNVHRGGRCEEIQLEPEYERVAVHAAQVMGLRVAGVDLLEGRDGPVLLEVNSSPGLEAIEAATKVDVAGEIVRLIEEEVLFPEIDIRQRLTLQSGYGVIEVPIDDRSELCGKTIENAALRERDVIVLTEQFRIATHDKGPGYLIEAIAGSVDEGEAPEDCLRREMMEEPPALFLAWNQGTRAVRREFQILDEGDSDPLDTIGRWNASRDTKVATSLTQ